jgi:hypothetical protein
METIIPRQAVVPDEGVTVTDDHVPFAAKSFSRPACVHRPRGVVAVLEHLVAEDDVEARIVDG